MRDPNRQGAEVFDLGTYRAQRQGTVAVVVQEPEEETKGMAPPAQIAALSELHMYPGTLQSLAGLQRQHPELVQNRALFAYAERIRHDMLVALSALGIRDVVMEQSHLSDHARDLLQRYVNARDEEYQTRVGENLVMGSSKEVRQRRMALRAQRHMVYKQVIEKRGEVRIDQYPLVKFHPKLRALCPHILLNHGLMGRLRSIGENFQSNAESLNMQNFAIHLRSEDPSEYVQEVYNFFAYFDDRDGTHFCEMIDIVRGEDGNIKSRRVLSHEELESIQERASSIRAVADIYGEVKRAAIKIRARDIRRYVPGESARTTIMEHLFEVYRMRVYSGNYMLP